MTYHRPLFIGNVLKVRLSCVKHSEKISKKNHGKGEKNQDRDRIYTPLLHETSTWIHLS